jgi:hypothetical protein
MKTMLAGNVEYIVEQKSKYVDIRDPLSNTIIAVKKTEDMFLAPRIYNFAEHMLSVPRYKRTRELKRLKKLAEDVLREEIVDK